MIHVPAGNYCMSHSIREQQSPQLGQHQGFITNCPSPDMRKTKKPSHYHNIIQQRQCWTQMLDARCQDFPGCGLHRDVTRMPSQQQRHTELTDSGHGVHTCLFVSILCNLQHYDDPVYAAWKVQCLKQNMVKWIRENLEKPIQFNIKVREWIYWTQMRHKHNSETITCVRTAALPAGVSSACWLPDVKQFENQPIGIYNNAELHRPFVPDMQDHTAEIHLCNCHIDTSDHEQVRLVTCKLCDKPYLGLSTFTHPEDTAPSIEWFQLHTNTNQPTQMDIVEDYLRRLLVDDCKGGDIEIIVACYWLQVHMTVFSDGDHTVTWGRCMQTCDELQLTFSHAPWDPTGSSQHWSARLPPSPTSYKDTLRRTDPEHLATWLARKTILTAHHVHTHAHRLKGIGKASTQEAEESKRNARESHVSPRASKPRCRRWCWTWQRSPRHAFSKALCIVPVPLHSKCTQH